MDPTVSQALSRGASAVSRSAWLAAVGLLVTVLRTALLLPAQIFVVVMLRLAATSWLARHGRLPIPQLAGHGVEIVLTSPRFIGIAVGLWLGGAILAGALRIAYLSGALPTLGCELARTPRQHRFAAGFARGFAALLPAGVAAFALDVSSVGAAVALLTTAVFSASRLAAAGHAALGAASAALGVSAGLMLVAMASALADAALCRAAVRGEGAAHAFGRAAIRLGRRPAAFLAVGIAATVASIALAASVDALAAVGAGAAAANRFTWLAVGPQLVAATLAALAAALIELWRLASTAVLACHTR